MARLDDETLEAAVDILVEAHRARADFQPLPVEIREAGLDEAYRVQARFVERLVAEFGAGAPVGYKIALTSQAMQTMIGVDQPLAGVVLAERVFASPARIALSDFQRLGLEFEVAVRLASPLGADTAPHTIASVADRVDAIAAAFELVEDRNADFDVLEPFSLVADNAWNGGAIIGEWVTDWRDVDLEDGATRAWVNDMLSGEGRMGDALGHPLAAVAWLGDSLAARGETLPAGALVLTGSSITTRFPVIGQAVRFEADGLPSIEVSFHE